MLGFQSLGPLDHVSLAFFPDLPEPAHVDFFVLQVLKLSPTAFPLLALSFTVGWTGSWYSCTKLTCLLLAPLALSVEGSTDIPWRQGREDILGNVSLRNRLDFESNREKRKVEAISSSPVLCRFPGCLSFRFVKSGHLASDFRCLNTAVPKNAVGGIRDEL